MEKPNGGCSVLINYTKKKDSNLKVRVSRAFYCFLEIFADSYVQKVSQKTNRYPENESLESYVAGLGSLIK